MHKILSFWLIHRTETLLLYFMEPRRKLAFVESLLNHLYLANCVTDMVVRLCTVAKLPTEVDPDLYEEFR